MASSYQSEDLKNQGNIHFKNGDFDKAVVLYSQAILKNPSNPLLYTNRANARMKLLLWQDVLDDCLRSIELREDNMKAFYFLGKSFLSCHCSSC
jgi:STIP1 homology and U-box containing protein 1